jgi:excisionase family DNA binding protein
MHNPFEILNKRLETIEELLSRLALQNSQAQQPAPQVGGVELAQEVTHLSKSRIYVLVSERSIPHAKRGNRLFFNRQDLLQWVADGNRVAA